MAGRSKREYVNTRARFQRLVDGKFFSGWVIDLTYPTLLVKAATEVALNVGEEFRFQLSGTKNDCHFTGAFKGIDDLDVLKNSTLSFLDGSNVQMMSVHENTFEFEITSELSYKDPTEPARKSVQTLEARYNFDDTDYAVQIIDISKAGCAFLSPVKIPSGTTLSLSIVLQGRMMNLEAVIKTCRKSQANPMFYRVGVSLTEMARIDQVSWNQLLEAE